MAGWRARSHGRGAPCFALGIGFHEPSARALGRLPRRAAGWDEADAKRLTGNAALAGDRKSVTAVNPTSSGDRKNTSGNDELLPPLPFRQSRVEMIENQKIRPAMVIGPLGEPLTWSRCRRRPRPRVGSCAARQVVAAVNGGLLSIDEVCERWPDAGGVCLLAAAVDRSGMQGA
jgi:hypothetical protein